jgi:hypothetical protein
MDELEPEQTVEALMRVMSKRVYDAQQAGMVLDMVYILYSHTVLIHCTHTLYVGALYSPTVLAHCM